MPTPQIPAIESALTHRCARCRLDFPLDQGDDPRSAADWWACDTCRAILLPNRKP